MAYTLEQKSKLLIEETVEAGRNKPINSTQIERIKLIYNYGEKIQNLCQPLRLAYMCYHITENVSCPVEEYDILLGRVVDRVLTEEEEAWFSTSWEKYASVNPLRDWGHITFDWNTIIELGINGYIQKAEARLKKAIADGCPESDLVFLQAMILVYQSYRSYILRYADAAEKKGLLEAAQISRNIADNPPKTFIEAIQLVLYITHVYSVYSSNSNATLSMGRLDDYLYPFYENDIKNGTLTREDAGYIIDDFNAKCALVLGRGEHQMSGGSAKDTGWYRNPMYDSPTYGIIGGLSNHREGDGNDLTKLFLERIHPRFENPVYVLRRTNNIPDDVWEVACDKLRANSTLVVYNDETVIPALERMGLPHEDAVDYTYHGCNWVDFNGKGKCNEGINGIMPKFITSVLWNAEGKLKTDFKSMDEIYEAVGENWREHVRSVYNEVRARQASLKDSHASDFSVVDCFMQGCIDRIHKHSVASDYDGIYCQIRNIGTATDIMAALDNVVFKKKAVTLEELGKILNANFEGYEDIYKLCKNSPKYGTDDDFADAHAHRLMTLFTDITYEESYNSKTGERDIYGANVTITDMWHRNEGAAYGATPDGRLKGVPLSENLSPTAGCGDSVTALLNSVAKLPLNRFASGALNVRIPKNLVSGDDGLERCKILFSTYFENGGMQLQLSVADTDELKDAQLHPEKYPDLMVRITGYSAVFVDMCKSAQDEFIRRDEVS